MELTNQVLTQSSSEFQIFRTDPKAKLPTRGTPESAGYDLYSVDWGVLYPGDTRIFSIGLIMRPPLGYHIKVWGRSGFGSKYGVGIPHAMGLIDRDFCGPDDVMKVVLHRAWTNNPIQDDLKPLEINIGDRIAQMTIEKTNYFDIKEIEHPPREDSRGGFGSTGVK